MEGFSQSRRAVLFLFSFLIGVLAKSTALSPSSPPLSLGTALCIPDQNSDSLHLLNALLPDHSTSAFYQLDMGWRRRPKMLSWNTHVTRLGLSFFPPTPGCYFSAGSSNSAEPSTFGLLNPPPPEEAETPTGSTEFIYDLHSLQISWLNLCSFIGSIPLSLGNLTWVTLQELSYNEFSEHVPPTLSNLDQLCLLDLSSNKFIGPVTDAFDNKTLLPLDVSHNLFKGPIPMSLKNLSNFAHLDFSNDLTGGFVSSSLFSLQSLMSLDLSNNGLSGQNGEFFAAPSLDHVDLSGNQLRGSISSSIFQLRNLTNLSISANNLTRDLDLQLLSRLKSPTNLDLSDKILSLSNSKKFEHVRPSLLSINLSRCRVTEIPAFLRISTSIEWIDLSGDRIVGNIPSCMWDSGPMSLSYINLSDNLLSSFDKVPWKNHLILNLHLNLSQGPVQPPSFPNSVLIFLCNRLTGYVPGSIYEMNSLQFLDLSYSNFIGLITQCLENISNSLLVLDIPENGLSGTISLTITKKAVLRNLHLNGYQFEVPRLRDNKLPDTFFNWLETLPSLQVMVLQSNRLCGPISNPATEFAISRLRKLELSFNDFTGPLDLFSSELSGTMPTELTNLTSLEVLKVSCIQLTGPIPHWNQFNTFQAKSYQGNQGLCWFALSKACNNSNAQHKLPMLPQGGVHSFLVDFLKPRTVEIGLGCAIMLGLIMHILKNLLSIWWTNRDFRKITALTTISKTFVWDPKMKKAASSFLYCRKFGDCKKQKQMAFAEGTSGPVKFFVVLLFLLGEMSVFASASLTLVYDNTCPFPIFPSLIPTGGCPAINNSTSLGAIGPNKVRSYTLPDGWTGIGLFGTGCVSDRVGTRDCATGNCEARDCTAEDSPVATNYMISSDGYITISAEGGYNLGLEIGEMCAGCSPPVSCKAHLGSCPTELRVLDSSRDLVGCKSSWGLHFYQNECTISSDYGSSTVRVSFQKKNAIVKISVSQQY